jgi:hypothetical protein
MAGCAWVHLELAGHLGWIAHRGIYQGLSIERASLAILEFLLHHFSSESCQLGLGFRLASLLSGSSWDCCSLSVFDVASIIIIS